MRVLYDARIIWRRVKGGGAHTYGAAVSENTNAQRESSAGSLATGRIAGEGAVACENVLQKSPLSSTSYHKIPLSLVLHLAATIMRSRFTFGKSNRSNRQLVFVLYRSHVPLGIVFPRARVVV